MAEFLEILESFNANARDARALFTTGGSDGVPVRPKQTTLQYKKKLAEAVNFLSDVIRGSKPTYLLREVMSTDDFPLLFGDILDRTLLAAYQEWPMTWTSYAKRIVLNDFRDAKVTPPVYGADGALDVVPEGDQYPDAALTEQSPFTWHVDKYGRKVPFTWETIINDDLGQLQDIPERLGRAARRTEHRLVTGLFVGTTGPHASMYTVGAKNVINTTNGAPASVGNNPPLTIAALQAALTVMSKMVDESGEPIMREWFTLVVPPALEITALNILQATTIRTDAKYSGGNPSVSDSGRNELEVRNWMAGRIKLEVDPYIPIIANSSNGDTSWFIFANPNYSREAIRIGFLRGHETPEIWMKSPNAVRVGGGAVSPLSGDFDTDSVTYRVRHVTGVARVDPKATVASNGSGS